MKTLIALIMGLLGITKKAVTGNNNNQPTNGVTNTAQVVADAEAVEATSASPTLSELVERMTPMQVLQTLRISEVKAPKVIRRPDGTLKIVHVESNRTGKPYSFKVRKVEGGDIFIQRRGHRRARITCRPLSIFE